MLTFSATKITNWSNEYLDYVSANKNKNKSVNRWYPILEGFSNGFVESILNEQERTNITCLDPFSGGGTTPLVCQANGIKCYGFEISPFMSQVCRAKLCTDYSSDEFIVLINNIQNILESGIKHKFKIGLKTITKKSELEKWLFHKAAYNALLNIRNAIDITTATSPKYKDILYVTLGSILIQFSNVYRNGKALKYKDGWKEKIVKTKSVYETFLNKCKENVLVDIKEMEDKGKVAKFDNTDFFVNGDCRQLVDLLEDDSVDVVITSPPYLNSRDYTDSHMIELWMLGHVQDYEDVRDLRKNTMRSHVQVRWGDYVLPQSEILKHRIDKVLLNKEKFWNAGIPSMIAGYFCDLEELLVKLKAKMKRGGKLYINVANSSYFGVVIETDRIIEEIANNVGYEVCEIRMARKIKTSSQQTGKVKWLRETVIVLKKE
ncbi:site-specific DNA-methyltransferase [Paenibacillus donghaensis]|uniref:hypothetical protein n=1 Tax=Paenibacillus donghaensis TaxID=414771 RepID=UPI001884168B|nr:hypothetical protein [Paenibacillus donghaensis]MBE9917856.1 site-specific DNA-methyltransferase [Paenibacillus donghaensis]